MCGQSIDIRKTNLVHVINDTVARIQASLEEFAVGVLQKHAALRLRKQKGSARMSDLVPDSVVENWPAMSDKIDRYDIYEKEIKDAFAGAGIESLIVKDDTILTHVRGWGNPSVVDDDWQAPLAGKPVKAKGRGWHKLRRSRLRNAQAWARDRVE